MYCQATKCNERASKTRHHVLDTDHVATITIRHTVNLGQLQLARLLFVMKRALEEVDNGEHPSKSRRLSKPDRLSRLSDELLVRVLSFVPIASLLVCQRYKHLNEVPQPTLTFSGYRRSLVASRSTPNSGKLHIIAPSSSRAPLAFPASRTPPPRTDFTILRDYPSGWKTVT